MRYTVSATVNYLDKELDKPENGGNMDDTLLWIYRLLDREPKATSFLIVVVPEGKEPHENVI